MNAESLSVDVGGIRDDVPNPVGEGGRGSIMVLHVLLGNSKERQASSKAHLCSSKLIIGTDLLENIP